MILIKLLKSSQVQLMLKHIMKSFFTLLQHLVGVQMLCNVLIEYIRKIILFFNYRMDERLTNKILSDLLGKDVGNDLKNSVTN